jgi:uridylate kinase
MKVVVSLGGSVLSLDNPGYMAEVASLIKKVAKEMDIYVVVGGGKTARKYISTARKFCNDERYLDRMGIMATRMNAMLLNSFFRKRIPHSIEYAARMKTPVIMGGTTPGHSTDAVAAMLAAKIKASRLIIATDVDGVYDRDPKKHRDARKMDRISIKVLRKMAGEGWREAGKSAVIDAIACRIIEENAIPTFVLNGKKLEELENAIYGREFNGTVVEI